MQCQFMAKLFAKVMVMLAHNHLKYKGSVLVFTYRHAFSLLAYRDSSRDRLSPLC